MTLNYLFCGFFETNVRHLDPGDVAFIEVEFDLRIVLADVI
jgi:hypothetical protein